MGDFSIFSTCTISCVCMLALSKTAASVRACTVARMLSSHPSKFLSLPTHAAAATVRRLQVDTMHRVVLFAACYAYPTHSHCFILVMDQLCIASCKARGEAMHGCHVLFHTIQLQQGIHCCCPNYGLLHEPHQFT